MMRKLIPILAIAVTSTVYQANAQCTAPTNADVNTTPAICYGQGGVNVFNVTGIATDSMAGLQYALFEADGTTIVKPYQSAPSFTEVAYGSYVVKIRHQCNPTAVYTSPLRNVLGTDPSNPITLNTSTISKINATACNNGLIFTTPATGGAGNYTYALVPSLNEPEPVVSYVHPPISANGSSYSYSSMYNNNAYFDSLAPGTYYLRAYDSCGSFATRQITINSEPSVSPSYDSWKSIVGCDSINLNLWVNSFTTRFGTNYYYLDKYINNHHKFYIQYGTSTDTLPYTLSGFTSPTYAMSQLQNGIDDTMRYTLSHINDCGVSTSKSYKFIIKDTLIYTFNRTTDSCKNRYNFSTYYESYLYDGNTGSYLNYQAIYPNSSTTPTYFSVDSGLTWSTNYSILMEPGDTVDFAIANACGDTSRVDFLSAPNELNIQIQNQFAYSCPGKGAITLLVNYAYYSDANALLDSIRVLSQPGSSLDSLITNPNIIFPLRGLDSGMYKFIFYDKCGNMKEDSILVTPLILNVTIDTVPSPEGCGVVAYDKLLKVTIESNYNDWMINLKNLATTFNTTTNVWSVLSADSFIYNWTAPLPYRLVKYFVMPSAGTYTTNVYSFNNMSQPECGEKDTISVSTASQVATLTLAKSIFTTSCADNTGTVVAQAASGGGGYQYALWRLNPDPDSLIYPASTNNIFNNLNPSYVYEIRVTDQCGNGTQYSTSFSNAPIPINANRPDQPCNGDSIIVSMPKYSNTIYAFYVNGVEVQNDTINSYKFITTVGGTTIDTISSAVSFGTCYIPTAQKIIINPAECGEPLNLEVLHFEGKIVNNLSHLFWKTNIDKEEGNFEVEYSADAHSFNKIGTVRANENTTSYSFIDQKNTTATTRYYRLKSVNVSGSYAYSDIIKLTTNTYREPAAYKVYPTLVDNQINVSSTTSLKNIKWNMVNINGQIVSTGIFHTDNEGVILLNNNIQSGSYLLNIESTDNIQSFKIIKK